MKTNHKLLCAVLIGVSIGITGGLAIRGEEANTAPGYVVAEAEVTDPAARQNYAEKVQASLAPFNHHFVIRSNKIQALEGDAPRGVFGGDRLRQRGEGARVVRLAGLCGDKADQGECS